MFARDIIWDIDLEPGEYYEDARAELGLPTCVELPKYLQLRDSELIDGCRDFDDDVINWLSKEYGFRAISFVWD
jgi:hypothetical protein